MQQLTAFLIVAVVVTMALSNWLRTKKEAIDLHAGLLVVRRFTNSNSATRYRATYAPSAIDQSLYRIEKQINGGNPAVPGNDEVGPGVSWRVTRAARYPFDPSAIAQFLGRQSADTESQGEWP